jgi:hypothetical protein
MFITIRVATQTLYVRDEKLWARAKKLAGDEGLSGVIHTMLRAWVKQKEAEMQSLKRTEEMTEYAISVGPEAHEIPARLVFTGRLLADSRGFSVGQLPRIQVFEMKDRRLVVYRSWHDTPAESQGATYKVFRDYEELARTVDALDTMWIDGNFQRDQQANHSPELKEQIAAALGKELIIRLD